MHIVDSSEFRYSGHLDLMGIGPPVLSRKNTVRLEQVRAVYRALVTVILQFYM